MLHGALPQVLAGPGAVQAEHERVLLLPALGGEVRAPVYAAAGNPDAGSLPAKRRDGGKAYLVIILHHHQGQFALFKIHLGNFRPGQRESMLKAQSAGATIYTLHSPFLPTGYASICLGNHSFRQV